MNAPAGNTVKPRDLRPAFVEVPRELQRMARIHQPADAEPPILTGPVRDAVHRWLIEIQCEEELQQVGLAPRRTGIFAGPPGCGKTTLAHHLAARLGVALVEVNLQQTRSQYIGESGRNIDTLFSICREHHQKMVLFVDEIDAMAATRTNDGQGGSREANAIVVALMSQIDHYPGMMIAATNMADNIDPALWRRFGIQLEIGMPDADSRYAILARYLAPYTLPEQDIDILCDVTIGATPALLRNLMEGIKRDIVLSQKFGSEGDAVTVIGRVAAALQPHANSDLPPLWHDFPAAARRLKQMSWPPGR